MDEAKDMPSIVTRDKVSFSMYDFNSVREATDRLFATWVRHASSSDTSSNSTREKLAPLLAGSGPYRLGEERDQTAAESVWADSRLFISQICGQNMWDMQQQQKQSLVPIASP